MRESARIPVPCHCDDFVVAISGSDPSGVMLNRHPVRAHEIRRELDHDQIFGEWRRSSTNRSFGVDNASRSIGHQPGGVAGNVGPDDRDLVLRVLAMSAARAAVTTSASSAGRALLLGTNSTVAPLAAITVPAPDDSSRR